MTVSCPSDGKKNVKKEENQENNTGCLGKTAAGYECCGRIRKGETGGYKKESRPELNVSLPENNGTL